MANKNQNLTEDIAFILSERARLHGELVRGDRNFYREDLFCDLPHPNGVGTLPIGRRAFNTLERLSNTAIARANLSGRVTIATARSLLAKEISRRFIGDRCSVDIPNVDRTLAAVTQGLKRALVEITHLLPCYLMTNNDPQIIIIGPVTFLNRAPFRTQISPLISTWKMSCDIGEIDRKMMAETLRYYRGFPWIASVTVKNCDAKTSGTLATEAVTSALNCLHLLLGASATTRMSVGGRPRNVQRTAELSITDRDCLAISLTTSWPQGERYEDGWSAELAHPGMQRAMQLCGIAVDALVTGLRRPLIDRFLGAIQWYGEAVRENSPSTRILKFMTAIEHIVLAGDDKEITSLMASRVAALISGAHPDDDPATIRRKFSKLYTLRSDLVHGSISPSDPKVVQSVGSAAELAEYVLNGALSEWGEDGLLSERINPQRLRDWYNRAVAIMDGTQGKTPQ